jgi:glycogen phosphorylase
VKGYGIRYEYGMFRQQIENGRQKEEPDHWLRDGNPWELERPEHTQGAVLRRHGTVTAPMPNGAPQGRWVDTQRRAGGALRHAHPRLQERYRQHPAPVEGDRHRRVRSGEFNAGSYTDAVQAKNAAENITMVLYPNDASENGKVLRLRSSISSPPPACRTCWGGWEQAAWHGLQPTSPPNCFQLNDTHPTIAVAELMRLLMDEYSLEWEQAWEITRNCMAYTNHTLLPEALERGRCACSACCRACWRSSTKSTPAS